MSTTQPSLPPAPPGVAAGGMGASGGWPVAVAVCTAMAGLAAVAWQGAAADAGSGWRTGLLGLAVGLPALWLGVSLRRQQRRLDEQARRLADQDLQLQTLSRSTELLHRAEQVAETGSFDWNPVTGALHWSDGHFRLWGHAPGALKPDYAAFRARIHPDDLGALEARLQHNLDVGGRYEFTHRLRWPDGTVLEVLARGDVIHDTHGRAVRMVGTVQDITRRRAAEARLQLHEFLVNTITDPVSVVDESGTYLLVNQAWSQRTGLPAEQVVGHAPAVLQQQLGSPARDAALQRCLAGGQPEVVLAELDLPATGRRWWETTMFPFTEPRSGRRGAALVARDVTARQAAGLALAASVDNLRLTLNATGDAIFASDAGSPLEPLLFVNDRMLQMWGIPADQAGALTPAAVMAVAMPQFADPAREATRVAEIIASGSLQEDRVALRDGRMLLRRCIPTQQAGRAVRVWGFRDITIESRALASLQAAEAQQRTLLAAFPGHIACIDANMRYTHVNARLADLLGTTPQAMVGRSVADVVGPQRAPQLVHRIARVLDGDTQSYERLHPASDGRPAVHMLVTLARGYDRTTGQVQCHAFGTDITTLKCTEAALQAAKHAAERANLAWADFTPHLPVAAGGTAGDAGAGGMPGKPPADGASTAADRAAGMATTPGTGTLAAVPMGGRRRVLYIDDNPVNTLLMAAMFERLDGLALQCECEPKAGVALALADPPALLLIDIQMPGIDGFEVLRRLRANPATQAVPAIAVSANAMPQDLARGRAAGFVDYLTKPLEMERLRSALQAVLPGWQAPPD